MQAPLSPDVERTADALARAPRASARTLAGAASTAKDDALRRAADGLRRSEAAVLDANQADLERTRAAGESAAFLDRLTLTPVRIDAMAQGLAEIAALPDPVGETIAAWRRPNGLEIAQAVLRVEQARCFRRCSLQRSVAPTVPSPASALHARAQMTPTRPQIGVVRAVASEVP